MMKLIYLLQNRQNFYFSDPNVYWKYIFSFKNIFWITPSLCVVFYGRASPLAPAVPPWLFLMRTVYLHMNSDLWNISDVHEMIDKKGPWFQS